MHIYSLNDLKLVLNNLGIILKFSSFVFLVPIIFVFAYDESILYLLSYLLVAIFVYFFSNLLLFKDIDKQGGVRHALLTTAFIWLIFNFFAAIPFFLIEKMAFIDSFFEAISMTTTTGLTTIKNPELISHSILFWRSFLSWIGGMGIIVLALVGVFITYNKYKILVDAEGRSDVIKSNVRKTVAYMWIIYVVVTILGILLLSLVGMPIFDSINYTFTSISTSGTDIRDDGLLDYNIYAAIITLGLMLFGATSFITHYLVIKRMSFKEYFKDTPFVILITLVSVTSFTLLITFDKLVPINALYNVISSITGGGLSLQSSFDILNRPEFYKITLITLMIIGGSTASTSGGIKIQRFAFLIKSIYWKIKDTITPSDSYYTKKIFGQVIDDKFERNVYSFVFLYLFFILFSTFVFSMNGFGFVDSLFEVTSAQTGAGTSIGIISEDLFFFGKVLLIFNMLIGRLEIIPIFSLMSLFMIRR